MRTAWTSFIGAFLALLVGCATPPAGEGGKSLPSTVLRFKGSARYAYNGDKGWTPIRGGEVLEPGARFQTAAGSTVELVLGVRAKVPRGLGNPDPRIYGEPFRSENTIRLGPDSVLILRRVAKRAAATWADAPDCIDLQLEAGGFSGSVSNARRELTHTVTLTGGTVRFQAGAQFWLDSPGRLIMRKGAATATLATNDTVRQVKAGDTLDFSTGRIMAVIY